MNPIPPPSIGVAITCFNRKQETASCLEHLYGSMGIGQKFNIRCFLLDDGSTDGTSQLISQQFPQATIIQGTGDLYWNRGMFAALSEATKEEPDYLLWLNDDTTLFPEAILYLLETERAIQIELGESAIVAGTTKSKISNHLTYGGLRSVSRFRPFSLEKLPQSNEIQFADAMNGNIVLIPRACYLKIGTLDPVFEHALGDIDYGFRARRSGVRIVVPPNFCGICELNDAKGSPNDESLGLVRRWKLFISRKGLPPRSWLHFVKRHTRCYWPLFFLVPYLKFALKLIFTCRQKGRNNTTPIS